MPAKSFEGIMYCKVCHAVVPRRKRYQPKICEACQKFFTRNFRKREQLYCFSGKYNCEVAATSRRFCPLCRFEKCLAVGMQSKLQTEKSSTCETEFNNYAEPACSEIMDSPNNSSSEPCSSSTTTTKETCCCSSTNCPENRQIVQKNALSFLLVRDPVLFDGTAVENSVKNCVHGFTLLHALEFMPLKRNDCIEVQDPAAVLELSFSQMYTGVATGLSYARFLADHYGCSDDEVNKLLSTFILPMGVAFSALPGNTLATFGINNDMLPAVLKVFPEFEPTIDICRLLADEMNEWKPTLAECAILFGLLLFNEQVVQGSDRLQRVRRQLVNAFHLYSSAMSKNSNSHCHLAKCLKLTAASVESVSLGVQLRLKNQSSPISPPDNAVVQQLFLAQPGNWELQVN